MTLIPVLQTSLRPWPRETQGNGGLHRRPIHSAVCASIPTEKLLPRDATSSRWKRPCSQRDGIGVAAGHVRPASATFVNSRSCSPEACSAADRRPLRGRSPHTAALVSMKVTRTRRPARLLSWATSFYLLYAFTAAYPNPSTIARAVIHRDRPSSARGPHAGRHGPKPPESGERLTARPGIWLWI